MSTEHKGVSRREMLAAGVALGAGALAHGARAQQAAAGSRPTKLPQGAGFYEFRVGDFRCFSLGDAAFELPVSPVWGGGNENVKSDLERVLAAEYLGPQRVPAYVQPLVIQTPKATILVDTGNGPREGEVSPLLTRLAAAGFVASDIDLVVMTHLHGDHTGGLRDASGAEVFADARYVMHRAEFDFWNGASPDLGRSMLPEERRTGMISGAKKALEVISPRCEKVVEGDEIVPGIRALHYPGHTPGLLGLEVTSGDAQVLVANDVVHQSVISFRRPQTALMFDVDPEAGAWTRMRFLDRVSADRALVFSYHMPFPALGRVRAEGGAFAWVADPWRWGGVE